MKTGWIVHSTRQTCTLRSAVFVGDVSDSANIFGKGHPLFLLVGKQDGPQKPAVSVDAVVKGNIPATAGSCVPVVLIVT
jgi:hypothetical protein